MKVQGIVAILVKDLRNMKPIILLALVMFAAETLLSNLELDTNNPFLQSIILALPQINTLVIGLVVITLFQQDPANSLVHDWLVRPISRIDFFAAKIFFLLLTITLPIFLARLLLNLFTGYPVMAAIVEASIARSPWTFMATILFIAVSVLSRSVVQSIVLFVGALLMFGTAGAVMDSFPRHADALQDDLTTQAVIWIIAVPLYGVFISALLLIVWFQYGRRNPGYARGVFAAGFVMTWLAVLLPFMLPSWPTFFSILRHSLVSSTENPATDVRLDPVYGCFPSSVVNFDNPVSGYGGLQRVIGSQIWGEEELRAAGTGSVSYATAVTARDYPRNWRIEVMKVTAKYSAARGLESRTIGPARTTVQNSDAEYTNVASNYWLLPGKLADEIHHATGVKLVLDFSLALLAPSSQRLATDGVRRFLPGIGYCRANREQIRNSIHVECFKRGPRPTYLAAALPEIPSSEVTAGTPSYTPGLLQWTNGRRYETRVNAASLSPEESVVVTAYKPQAYTNRTLSFDGPLGDATSRCTLPTVGDPRLAVQSSWSDTSPHETRYVSVEEEVSLEVLDWGGSGQVIVFIPGLGASAHSFDNIAPLLTNDYRVLGITRRGFGASSRPEHGYSIQRLSQDVLAVLESLNINTPILVGHSLGGDELSMIGSRHPGLAAGLIYLDAAYDRTVLNVELSDLSRKLPARPRPDRQDLVSYQAFQDYLARLGLLGANPIPEGEVMSSMNFNDGSRRLDPRIPDAIMAGIVPPDYENITVPALGIFATSSSPESLMEKWYDPENLAIRQTLRDLYQLRNAFQRNEIEKFRTRVSNSKVVELLDADHAVFLTNQEEVVQAMREKEGFP